MDERKNPQTTEDMKRTIPIRLIAIAFLLYMLADIVMKYVKGGPEAPTLTMLLIAIVIMGGGSIVVVWLTWRNWKRAKKVEEKTEE